MSDVQDALLRVQTNVRSAPATDGDLVSRTIASYVGVFLLPVAFSLTGCGVAPKAADPAAAAGVERCGSETRACWQVKDVVDAREYSPADASVARSDKQASPQQRP